MEETINQLEKARIFAYFAYTGLMFPVVGIVCAIISNSILDRLLVKPGDEENEAFSIRQHSRVGIGLSVAIIVVEAILIAIVLTTITHTVGQTTPLTQ